MTDSDIFLEVGLSSLYSNYATIKEMLGDTGVAIATLDQPKGISKPFVPVL